MNLQCVSCDTPFNIGDRFCEECGVSLVIIQPVIQTDVKAVGDPNPLSVQTANQKPCTKCTSIDIDLDGFCNQCGHRNPIPRDHQEVVFSPNFAAISDRGIRHSRNEDAFAIDRLPDGTHILVVCDGVSSSTDPGSASTLASQTACQSIVQDLNQGISPEVTLKSAIARASAAVTQLGHQLNAKGEPPSTTIVAAIALPPTSVNVAIHLAWVGDSRAYWLSDAISEGLSDGSSDSNSIPLTQDHSWMNEVVAAGEMTLIEAEASPNAHAITRWLGADSYNDEGPSHDEPSFAQYVVTQSGQLMVCSDGLWNYAPEPSALRDLMHQSPTDSDTIDQIKHCLNFALECGGQDNITIAVLNIPDK